MTQETRAFVTEKLNDLLAAPMACAEVKEAAENWLAASGTDREAEETKQLIAELEADIIPIDGLIAFAGRGRCASVWRGKSKRTSCPCKRN